MSPRFWEYLFGGQGGGGSTADAGLAILRVFTGLALALAHGVSKVPPSDGFIRRVGEMGLPAPEIMAWLAGLAEFGGGLLLAIGLATRPAALLIAVTMAIAAFVAHASDPFAGRELAFLFLAAALCFTFTGAGRYSLDHSIKRRVR